MTACCVGGEALFRAYKPPSRSRSAWAPCAGGAASGADMHSDAQHAAAVCESPQPGTCDAADVPPLDDSVSQSLLSALAGSDSADAACAVAPKHSAPLSVLRETSTRAEAPPEANSPSLQRALCASAGLGDAQMGALDDATFEGKRSSFEGNASGSLRAVLAGEPTAHGVCSALGGSKSDASSPAEECAGRPGKGLRGPVAPHSGSLREVLMVRYADSSLIVRLR